MKRGRVAIGIALAAALTSPPSGVAGADLRDRIHRKQVQIHAVHVKLSERRAQLDQARTRTEDLRRQLSETNASIAAVNGSLDVLELSMQHTKRRLAWNQVQLNAARATLQRHNEALHRRLIDMYEHGELSYLNVLLSAASFSDFVERWEDLRLLIAVNQRAVRERRSAEIKVASVQTSLQGIQSLLESQAQQQQHQRTQLAALAQERHGLVAAAEDQRRHVAAQVAQLEELSASQEAELQQLIVARQRQEEARRAAERRAAQLAGRAYPGELGPPGSLSWPASGPITSPFGLRFHPVFGGLRRHNGIDIGAPMSSTITAAAAGRVIFAGWYGGYGNAIIIDHGGGMSTIYGHCSQVFVANNQDVQRGQAIAAVGSTGVSTGPHLHFEVRINGVPVDPLARLR